MRLLKKISFNNLYHQYFIGLFLNFAYFIMLHSNSSSYYNIQAPLNKYANNIFYNYNGDYVSYTLLAYNFTHFGVFGNSTTPDYFRTIGYSFYISLFIRLFADNWLFYLQITQCILFASLYPAISILSRIFLDDKKNIFRKFTFLFVLFSGMAFTRVTMIYPDTLFAILFIWSMILGLYSFLKNKWYLYAGYAILMTCTCLVRPTIIILPVFNILICFFITYRYKILIKKRIIPLTITSILLVILCNISVIRNDINYGFLSPSSVVGINYFDYLSKKIMNIENNKVDYNSYQKLIAAEPDITKKTKLREKFTVEICKMYPAATVKVLLSNTINILLDNHLLNNTANFFGYNWKDYSYGADNKKYKISYVCYYGTYIFMIIYLIIWIFFIKRLISLIKQKEYWVLGILIFLFISFILPAIIVGNGGSRLRITFDCFLMIFSCQGIYLFIKSITSNNKTGTKKVTVIH
jgi:hypothetical protein